VFEHIFERDRLPSLDCAGRIKIKTGSFWRSRPCRVVFYNGKFVVKGRLYPEISTFKVIRSVGYSEAPAGSLTEIFCRFRKAKSIAKNQSTKVDLQSHPTESQSTIKRDFPKVLSLR
jgi:hypothetical protein